MFEIGCSQNGRRWRFRNPSVRRGTGNSALGCWVVSHRWAAAATGWRRANRRRGADCHQTATGKVSVSNASNSVLEEKGQDSGKNSVQKVTNFDVGARTRDDQSLERILLLYRNYIFSNVKCKNQLIRFTAQL